MTDKMNRSEPATSGVTSQDTEVGSVFVSNYPPYSFWTEGGVSQATAALEAPPGMDAMLGKYIHIPFCRKRCKFCYYKVYTDKNAGEVGRYLDAVVSEAEMYAEKAAVAGRPLKFVYFGGGTPSFISSKHLESLVSRLNKILPWDGAEEVTIEVEPGTLTERKVETIREVGFTRLSLGVESFSDEVLKENGRAHLSPEIDRMIPWIKAQDFDQLNLDLISGMVGETWDSWRDAIRKTIDIDPDSVTIYQMELPYNTVYSKEILVEGKRTPVASWAQKREWLRRAFERFENAGYGVSSGYTLVKDPETCNFSYRDSLWHGA
ncbi:MAG: radical SAM protein, partial [Acidobacteriota bacterium]|nr:radical SAM protein [Acidobacteriota bacterium]